MCATVVITLTPVRMFGFKYICRRRSSDFSGRSSTTVTGAYSVDLNPRIQRLRRDRETVFLPSVIRYLLVLHLGISDPPQRRTWCVASSPVFSAVLDYAHLRDLQRCSSAHAALCHVTETEIQTRHPDRRRANVSLSQCIRMRLPSPRARWSLPIRCYCCVYHPHRLIWSGTCCGGCGSGTTSQAHGVPEVVRLLPAAQTLGIVIT